MLFRPAAYALGGYVRRARNIGAVSSPKASGVSSVNLATSLVSMGAQAGDIFVGTMGTLPSGVTLTTPGSQTEFPAAEYFSDAQGVIFTGTLTEGHLSDFTCGGTTQSAPVIVGVWRGAASAVVMGQNTGDSGAMTVPYTKTSTAAGAVALARVITPTGAPGVNDSGWTNRAGQQFGNWNHQLWDNLDLSDYAASSVSFSNSGDPGQEISAAIVELRF